MHRPIIDNSQISDHSKQNLVCNWTGSADFGRLVPIHWEELVAGDHVITCKPRIEMQMLPLASPTFGQIDLYCHFFVVPIRQLLDGFYDAWSGTGPEKDTPIPNFTYYQLKQAYDNDLANDNVRRAAFKHWTSMGLNPCFAFDLDIDYLNNTEPLWDLPFRAYNKIWFDFYRDPEVIRDESKGLYLYSGSENNLISIDQDSVNRFMLPHVRSIKNNWIADLFAQSGLENSAMGVGLASPSLNPGLGTTSNAVQLYSNGDSSKVYKNSSGMSAIASNIVGEFGEPELRKMEALTRLAERLSLSGKRQIEQLFANYGVKPNWAKMNLCRYIGGSKSTVLVDNIISNADTADGNGVGSQLGAKAGVGYCAMNQLNVEVSVDEPSILMGIVSVMPHIHFVQGHSKKWQRSSISDMFNPAFQRTGQVAVAKREVALLYRSNQGYDISHDGDTFAFNDPYYEYKYGQDVLAGDFMYYHNVTLPVDPQAKKDVLFMQSMEQYIDYPYNRTFNYNNLLVDGDQYNKIFSYLGGSVWEDVDDHFWLSVNKDIEIIRPMDGFGVGTLETTENPHAKKVTLTQDVML